MCHIYTGAIAPGTTLTCIVTESEYKFRLDQFLAKCFPDYSRSYLQQLIENGHVTLQGKNVLKPRAQVKTDESVIITFPALAPAAGQYTVADLAHLPVRAVYEHQHFLVIEKPAGLTVHAASSTHTEITLVDWLVAHFAEIKQVGASDRPGIVHRLDKDTSGLLVIARNAYALGQFGDMFKNRTIHKTYIAIVQGHPPTVGAIDFAITRHPTERTKMTHLLAHGRESLTNYNVQEFFTHTSLVSAFPVTGRTHQIRVHFNAIGHPLVGDKVYGKASPLIPRHALHAHKLTFTFEGTVFSFESPLPADMQKTIETLKKTS